MSAPAEILQPVFGLPCIDLEEVGLAPIHQAVGQLSVVPLCDEAMVRSLLSQVCSAEAEGEGEPGLSPTGPCTEDNQVGPPVPYPLTLGSISETRIHAVWVVVQPCALRLVP